MRRQFGPEWFQTRPATHPEILGILGHLATPYVKGVSPNCKNLVRRSGGPLNRRYFRRSTAGSNGRGW